MEARATGRASGARISIVSDATSGKVRNCPNQASTVHVAVTISRLSPMARPMTCRGVGAPGSSRGPRVNPGRTKRAASATVVWAAASATAMGSMDSLLTLDKGA